MREPRRSLLLTAAARALGAIGKPAIKSIRTGLGDARSRLAAMVAVEALGTEGASSAPTTRRSTR